MARTPMPRSIAVTVVLAVVISVAAVVTVVVLRARAERHSAEQPGAGGTPSALPASDCGAGPCQVVESVPLDGTVVELLVGTDGRAGRIRVGGPAAPSATVETALPAMNVRLGRDSLRCLSGSVSVCLVRGPQGGGMVGEVFAGSDDAWRTAGRPYLSDAGAILLGRVTGDAPQVIVVRHDCTAVPAGTNCQVAPVLAEVFDLAARPVGCTRRYTSPSQLPGWPEVRLTDRDLRPCP